MRTIEERCENLRQFVRMFRAGGCRRLSAGELCVCPLCEIDALYCEIDRMREIITTSGSRVGAMQNGKTILDFQTVWLDQERSHVARLKAENDRLRCQLNMMKIAAHPQIVVEEAEDDGS